LAPAVPSSVERIRRRLAVWPRPAPAEVRTGRRRRRPSRRFLRPP